MRLVLVGAPGSGKGTQAATLVERLKAPQISTGDMLRAARAAGTPLGKEAQGYMDAGKLVPDSVVIGLVEERLQKPDAQNGFILDGFPRTTAQADALGALLGRLGKPLDRVVQIDVPSELLVERTTLRRTDKRTGRIYHLKYSPPPPDAELEHRADDREETVKQRLSQYEAMTAALLPYYERLGILTRVDGVGEPKEVTARVLGALGLSAQITEADTTETGIGTIEEVLPSSLYRVRLADGTEVLAAMAPRARHAVVRLIKGHRVKVERSSRDPSRGHIVEKL